MRSTNHRTVKLRIPNIRWHITLSGPVTRGAAAVVVLQPAIDPLRRAAFAGTNLFRHAVPNPALTPDVVRQFLSGRVWCVD
jgi:hypothetical protein